MFADLMMVACLAALAFFGGAAVWVLCSIAQYLDRAATAMERIVQLAEGGSR
jgi:hypothetical protein